MMLKLGSAICSDLGAGANFDAEQASRDRAAPDSFSNKDVGQIMTGAQLQLCRDTL